MIRITLLGTPGLHGPDGPVHGRAAQRMRVAFLAILAVQRGSPISRDRLIGLLWPEHDGDRARRLLSEALYVVRKELGEEVIVAAGDDLRLADAHRHLRSYLLGLLAARMGDASDAEARARELDGLGRSGELAALGRGLAASVRAHLAAAGGDGEAALRHLADAAVAAPIERVMISPFFARSPDRWLRAGIAREAGDDEEALRWLRSLTDGYEFLYAAPAHRAIGEILEAAGRREEAAAHFRRYLELRADAEPALRPETEAVARRLAALTEGR